jgi:hypothetical protein
MGKHELQSPPGVSREEADSLRSHMQDVASSVLSSEPTRYRSSGLDYVPVPTDPFAQEMQMYGPTTTLGELADLGIRGVGKHVDRSISPQS